MSLLYKSLDGHASIQYTPEVTVKCAGRNLRWDMVVTEEHGKFHIESDGLHHFTLNVSPTSGQKTSSRKIISGPTMVFSFASLTGSVIVFQNL